VVNRTYTAAGTYTVTLTAKDEWGNVGTATQTVTIAEPADNTAPTMLAIDTPACNALSCSLVGRFRDNLGDSTSRVWVWGDNTTNGTSSGTVSGTGDQLVTTSHTFAAAGTYIVTLTVTDGWGRLGTVTKSVTVTG
jgi:PKD repeat protein